MKDYELFFVFPGTLTETDLEPKVAEIKSMLEEQGAQDITIESQGKSRLAYPIKHIRYGYLHLAYFQAEPAAIAKMTAKMGIMSDLLRGIIRTYDPKSNARKSIQMQAPRPAAAAPSAPDVTVREVKKAPKKKEAEEKKETKDVVETKADDIKVDEIDKKLDSILDDSDIASV